jgi:hypothetical protein
MAYSVLSANGYPLGFSEEHHMRAIVALTLLFATTSAMAAGSSAGFGGGGRPEPFLAIVQQYNQSGESFHIVGHCQSSCTIFLGIRSVCIEPGATLLFHAAHQPRTTGIMRGSYNSALSAYLDAHHALDSPAFFTISGADMISKFGYRRC